MNDHEEVNEDKEIGFDDDMSSVKNDVDEIYFDECNIDNDIDID